MTGASEILVLILLIACVLILPGFFRRPDQKPKDGTVTGFKTKLSRLSIKTRAAMLASVLFPVAAALILKPWNSSPEMYVLIGILPVVLFWALIWVYKGKKP